MAVYTLRQDTTANHTKATIFTVTGTTITSNATIELASEIYYPELALLDEQHVLIVGNSGDGNMSGVVITITGPATMSAGTIQTMSSVGLTGLFTMAPIKTQMAVEGSQVFIVGLKTGASITGLFLIEVQNNSTIIFSTVTGDWSSGVTGNQLSLMNLDSNGDPVWFCLTTSTFYLMPIRIILPETTKTGIALASAAPSSVVSVYEWGFTT
jgi:hypothetical protein